MPDGTFIGGTFSAGDVAAHQLSLLAAAPASANIKSASGLVIKAHKANTGIVWLGHDANVAVNNGFPLDPGDMLSLDLLNPGGKIFVLQSVAADRFSVAVIKP